MVYCLFEHNNFTLQEFPNRFLEKLTACAGIAIVKSHYPFARAYDLADELAGSAKCLVNNDAHYNGDSPIRYSALDWHITTGGLYGDLDVIRDREYPQESLELENGEEFTTSLTLRPVFLQAEAHPYRTWDFMRKTTGIFQTEWAETRSKSKRLMDALRQGKVEVEVFNMRYLDGDLELPDMADFARGFGFHAMFDTVEDENRYYCGYYDALELMDLYVPLMQTQPEGIA